MILNYRVKYCFLWLTLIAILVIVSPTYSTKARSYLLNKRQCTMKRQHQLEMLMARTAPVGNESRERFPESFEQLQKYCQRLARILAQTETFFKDCYDKTVRDYANILIYTSKRNMKKYCSKKQTRFVAEMLKLAPCANRHVRNNPVPIKCYDRFINETTQLIGIENDNLKIPHACCNSMVLLKCAEEFMYSIPCLQKHTPMLLDYFRTGTSSISDIMCGEYNDQTDSCMRLGKAPKPVKKLKQIKYVTPMALLIDLMESIHNVTSSPTLQFK